MDKEEIKKFLIDVGCESIKQTDATTKVLEKCIDTICDLTISPIPYLDELETDVFRRRLGIISGKEETFSSIAIAVNKKINYISIVFNRILKKTRNYLELEYAKTYTKEEIYNLKLDKVRFKLPHVYLLQSIETIGELISLPKNYYIHAIGKKNTEIIENVLKEFGLSLTDFTSDLSSLKQLKKEELLKVSIYDIGLSYRTANALYYYGKINNVSDLVNLDKRVLKNIREIGSKGKEEVEKTLIDLGLKKIAEDEDLTKLSKEELLDLSIERLGLPTRTITSIRRHKNMRYNKITIRDLISFDRESLMNIEGMGIKGLNEIISALNKLGLSLNERKEKSKDYYKALLKTLEEQREYNNTQSSQSRSV